MAKITPVNGYIFCARYKEPEKRAGALVLTAPRHYDSWWIVLDIDATDSAFEIDDIIQIKPRTHINVEWDDGHALVHPDNVIAIIDAGGE